jgi:hypothetical protein
VCVDSLLGFVCVCVCVCSLKDVNLAALTLTQTMGSCNPRLAAATNRVMSRHYPERLGYALLLNAPWIFNATWIAMKGFLDAATVAKITFVKVVFYCQCYNFEFKVCKVICILSIPSLTKKDSEMDNVFGERFPEELATWVSEEVRINKTITPDQVL